MTISEDSYEIFSICPIDNRRLLVYIRNTQTVIAPFVCTLFRTIGRKSAPFPRVSPPLLRPTLQAQVMRQSPSLLLI
jgi:hypothetical protein